MFTGDCHVFIRGVATGSWERVGLNKVRPMLGELIRCFKPRLPAEPVIGEGDVVVVRYTERGGARDRIVGGAPVRLSKAESGGVGAHLGAVP